MPKKPTGLRRSHDVVGVGDHRVGLDVRGGRGRRGGVAAGGGDVVEDPRLVAVLLLDVVHDLAAQPGLVVGRRLPDRHQQRHGVRTWW
jgi:hypothetical protein